MSKLTIDDIRFTLYKDRIKNNIGILQQCANIGIGYRTIQHYLYKANRRPEHMPTWLRVINYVLTLKEEEK